MNTKKIMSYAGSLAIALVPYLAAAQFTSTGALPGAKVTTYQGVLDLLKTLSGWMLGILIALAVVFLIYAAFLYLTSGGEQETLTKAKNYLVYAVVAIGVGLLARGLVILAASLFGETIS